MSSGETWSRIEDIFNEALQQPVDKRADWVRRELRDKPSACQQVLDMLAAHEQMGGFLQAPLLDFAGQAFGPYTATEEIGRGGMSVVYRGRRTDGDFDKQVAIKVVLLQTAAPLRQSETQILAGLEHPHIARLLDAGVTALGFRYLVMELVEGKPVTEYCTGKPEREKLRLFLEVCEAVQYAHRSLVVHRDLKPDNILVTANGEVKLLDFGIAKMLDPEAGAVQTRGARAFSPNYASPEQVLEQPVTTSTDVYSLGALLCELVGGRPPRLLAELTLERMVDQAREEVGAVPLKGDLGVIAQKALRRDAAARYESAGALGHDIERYLGGLPIEARSPTWSYRAGKFIARNKVAVALATTAIGGLIVTTGFAVIQARKADVRFNQVRELARAVMFDLHDEVRDLPGSLGARKMIVDRSIKYLDALAADTSASAEVQMDLAKGYLRLADIEGKDLGGASLGRSADALAHSLRAVEISRRVVSANPGAKAAQQVLVDALDYTTTAHTLRGKSAEAVRCGEEALKLAEQIVAADPAATANQERLATVTKQLADTYSKTSQRDKALPLFQRALEMRQRLYDQDPKDLRRQQRLAEANQWLGGEYWLRKDYANAGRHAREALRLDEARYAVDPRNARANVASDAVLVAIAAIRQKNYEEAVRLIGRSLELRREIAKEDPKSVIAKFRVLASLNRMGIAYREWGRYPEAIEYGMEALAEARRLHTLDTANIVATREFVFAMSDLALTYQKAGEKSKACQLARETLAVTNGKATERPLEPPIQAMTKLAGSCK